MLLIREYFQKIFRFEEALVGFFVRFHQNFCKYKFYTSKTIKFCEHKTSLELNCSFYNSCIVQWRFVPLNTNWAGLWVLLVNWKMWKGLMSKHFLGNIRQLNFHWRIISRQEKVSPYARKPEIERLWNIKTSARPYALHDQSWTTRQEFIW